MKTLDQKRKKAPLPAVIFLSAQSGESIMVDGFFQKAREFFGGSNTDEYEQESDYGDRQVHPASEDPFLDPEDQIYGDLSPASQDPFGDPADEYSNYSPASEDPFGDPADEYGH